MRPSKDLKSLSFATHDSRGYDGHDIEALEGMEKLRSLTLWGRRISLDAMKHLGRLSSLDYLCFGGSDNSTPITDEGLACLGNLQRLDDLDLTGTKVTARGMKPLTTLKNLRRLALIDTRVREGDVRELARALPNLEISGTVWDVQSVGDERDRRYVAKRLPQLAWLAAHNVRVKAIPQATVYMDDDDLTDRDLACLAKAGLSCAYLRGKKLTAAVLRHFQSDKHLQDLSLHLVNRGFEPKDIEPLEGKEYFYYLCLEGNSMSPSVLKQIGRLKSVYVLDLAGCPVTDEGLACLADKDYWRLSLAGSKITANGLKHLKSDGRLEVLDVSRTAITEADAEPLHRAIPKLTIYGGTDDDAWTIEGANEKAR